MVTFPPCKINLGLRVLSKRADGYHNISTCFYPLPWTDVLEILPSTELSFNQTGLAIPGNAKDNLCVRAYTLLRNDFDLPPVQIHLHKIIPLGAGLGGGSSDGAYTLRTLNKLFALNLSVNSLADYGSRLGSDVAFFLQDQPMIGEERGDKMISAQVNLKGYFVRIIKPDFAISTAEAYAHVVPRMPLNALGQIINKPLRQWKDELTNDFESSVFRKYPLVQTIKEELYHAGAVYASMSGSGSSVYGIFEDENRNVNYSLKESWSGWL